MRSSNDIIAMPSCGLTNENVIQQLDDALVQLLQTTLWFTDNVTKLWSDKRHCGTTCYA